MVLCLCLLGFCHLAAFTGNVDFEQGFGMVLFHDSVHQLRFIGVLNPPIAVFCNGIGMIFVKLNTPLKEQLEMDSHGMDASLHYHKITLGQRFQFVRC